MSLFLVLSADILGADAYYPPSHKNVHKQRSDRYIYQIRLAGLQRLLKTNQKLSVKNKKRSISQKKTKTAVGQWRQHACTVSVTSPQGRRTNRRAVCRLCPRGSIASSFRTNEIKSDWCVGCWIAGQIDRSWSLIVTLWYRPRLGYLLFITSFSGKRTLPPRT